MKTQNHRRRIWMHTALFSSLVLFAASIVVVANFLAMFLEPFGPKPKSAEEFGFSYAAGQKQGDSIGVDVYIPGAGFSGFYYTLGRLQAFHNSHPDPSTSEYYCFSAGCLALITSLLKLPIDSVIEMALTYRNRWITGEISRYDVVHHFIDGLLNIENDNDNATKFDGRGAECKEDESNSTKRAENCTLQYSSSRKRNVHNLRYSLPRINVLTSAWGGQNILSQSIQKPSSVEHLRRMLVETTWIPFVTGPSFGKLDDDTGSYHNDGAFAGFFQGFIPQTTKEIHFQPSRHHHSFLLPWSFDLLSNSLNLRLSHDRALHFWEEGLRIGVN